MFLLFFLLWLLLSGGISVHTCLWGVAVSALISWFCKRVLGYQWRVFCGSPSRIWAMARYFAHLLAEMLKAGLVIMRIIYTRPKGIEPKLVWFHTPLKTDRRRAMLADSITLTAGTITVRAEDGRMLVHTLDTPLAEGIEDSSFQQRLEEDGGGPMEQVRTGADRGRRGAGAADPGDAGAGGAGPPVYGPHRGRECHQYAGDRGAGAALRLAA